MSWGGRPSTMQPTDWAVPRISLMVPTKGNRPKWVWSSSANHNKVNTWKEPDQATHERHITGLGSVAANRTDPVPDTEMFQTFRHRDAHRVGQPCFLKPGQSQPPLDYTQPPWQAGIVAGGSKVMVKVVDGWNLTRELPGDGTMPHHASNIHDLIKGHAPAVLNYRRGIYEWSPTELLKKQVNLVAITYCSWPSSCHEEAPSEPWWLKRMQTEPPRSEKHTFTFTSAGFITRGGGFQNVPLPACSGWSVWQWSSDPSSRQWPWRCHHQLSLETAEKIKRGFTNQNSRSVTDKFVPDFSAQRCPPVGQPCFLKLN